MKQVQQIDEIQDWVRQETAAGRKRVLVPTMGGLHEGHLSLMDIARQRVGTEGRVVVSLFVNPTQFGRGEDLGAYPRSLERDRVMCEERGVDLLFCPEVQSMYAGDASVRVCESDLSRGLCGRSRPGHFDGVCTVVTKLFNLFQAEAAVFGQKDFQQLAIIRRLVRDLNYPIEIIGGPIVREVDGLAMSTRNLNLSPEERSQAVVLRKALLQAKQLLDGGERRAAIIRELVQNEIASRPLARLDYLETAQPATLQAVDKVGETLLVAVAVFFGKTRLIDNLYWSEEG